MPCWPALAACRTARLWVAYTQAVVSVSPPWTAICCQRQHQSFACLQLQATGRLRKNAQYFKVNYLIVMLAVTLITLVLNPTSLIALAFLAMAWVYLFVVRQSPIVIAGRTFRCLALPSRLARTSCACSGPACLHAPRAACCGCC